MFTRFPSKSNCITELVTEIPRCFSISIQSDFAKFPVFFPLTVPAWRIAPPNNNSCSVMVVLPASGWEIIAKVRRLSTCCFKLGLFILLLHSSLSNFNPISIAWILLYWKVESLILKCYHLSNGEARHPQNP